MFFRLLGKRNAKNCEADYVHRAWRTVFSDSLSRMLTGWGDRTKESTTEWVKKRASFLSYNASGQRSIFIEVIS